MSGPQPAKKRPTVVHLMPWSGVGGVEIATIRMVQATRDHVRNVAFCLSDATAVRTAFEKVGVETEAYRPPEPSLRHSGAYYRASRLLADQIANYEADIAHFSDEKAAYHNSLATVLAGTKRICHLRVSFPTLELRQKLCLLPIQSFIFVSNEAMDTFAMSVPQAKKRVIYDAIDIPAIDVTATGTAARQELGIPAECTVVGMLARVSPQKDYMTLANAAVKVLERFPDTRFLVVGDNSLVDLNRQHYGAVAARLNELGIADRFTFTGHRDDAQRFVAAMNFCVLSTHREGFPLSILESMALAKPVIATSVGGIPEIVFPDINGYLCEHGDSDSLAEKIMYLVSDPASVKRLGNAARGHVASNYSKAKYVAEILRAYSDVSRA